MCAVCSLSNSIFPGTNYHRRWCVNNVKPQIRRFWIHLSDVCRYELQAQQTDLISVVAPEEVMKAEEQVIVGTYGRASLVLTSGKGSTLYDIQGKEYVDLTSGIAVNALGHGDPDWVETITSQANLLAHVSNIYYSLSQVQCGLGRIGYLWAHEAYGVAPDIMTLAKPLAGGLPIGATLVTERVNGAIKNGDHGSTFAGRLLVCAVAITIFDKISKPSFLGSVWKKGEYLKAILKEKVGGNSHVKEVRGFGLIVGIKLDICASPLVDACRESGLLILTAGKGDVVRLVPPLIISEEELDHAVHIISKCMHVLSSSPHPN